MGSNMQRQAVPCIIPQAPLVSTGFEEKAAYDSGQMIISQGDGEVAEADAAKVIVRYSSPEKRQAVYQLNKFTRTNQYTCINQQTLVKKGDRVKEGQIIADGESTDEGVLSLGQNLLVAFLPWYGYNFEDAIAVSEKVVKEDLFSSVHIHEFICDVRETKLGNEVTTPDIPNVSEERLKDLDEEGIVRIGAEVRENDILVGKITPRGEEELSAEEKLLRAIFGEKAKDVKDTSLKLEHGRKGRVIGIKIFSRELGDKLQPGVIKRIHVEVAEQRKIMVGDKLAGRHGNKGVVSIIVPVEDMPYLEDGTPVDIVLSPVGVVKRMNLGQILETHLGWAAAKQGFRAVTPVFSGAREQEVRQELKNAGLPESGQARVFDGRTGNLIGDKVTVGYIYLMKLNHLIEDKIHMRSIGSYSLITQQPLGGKARGGGQRFGEMEVWALEGYGAAHTLQEVLTIKSDDIFGRATTYEALVKGEEIKKPNIPASFAVLVNELKGMALGIDLIGEKTQAERRAEEEAEEE
jgi:DNA-directed RNA polymerase subunit beta